MAEMAFNEQEQPTNGSLSIVSPSLSLSLLISDFLFLSLRISLWLSLYLVSRKKKKPDEKLASHFNFQPPAKYFDKKKTMLFFISSD
jgi:hypothetical protein